MTALSHRPGADGGSWDITPFVSSGKPANATRFNHPQQEGRERMCFPYPSHKADERWNIDRFYTLRKVWGFGIAPCPPVESTFHCP